MEYNYRLQYPEQATVATVPTATGSSQIPTCLPRESRVNDPRDDVIYLGKVARQLDRTTNEAPSPNLTSVQRPKGKTSTRLYHKRPHKVGKGTGGSKGSGGMVIPVLIRNKNIRIGHARDSGGQAYGFFDKAGRFRLQVEVDRSGGRADPGPFMVMEPISHVQVSYSRQYQNLSRKELRNEICKRLTQGIIDPLSQGEI